MRKNDVHEVQVQGAKISFSLLDAYSQWFFSRYGTGQIHEDQVTRLLLCHLENSSTFADVGCNLGWYACVIGCCRPRGRVYAFDIDQSNCDLAKSNIEINGCRNIGVYHLAVSDTTGRARYCRPEKSPGATYRILPEGRTTEDPEAVSVDSVCLDDFFITERVVPDVVKIDVEGAELRVLKGMSRIVAEGAPTLFVEYHAKELRELGGSCSELISLMEEYDYNVYEIVDARKPDVYRALRAVGWRSKLRGNAVLYGAHRGWSHERVYR